MADLLVSATNLNYVSVPPGSGDAVSTSFGYGYGTDKGQIGISFGLIANNAPFDFISSPAKNINLLAVTQNEDLPAGSPPYPDTPGDGKDHYTPTEGTGGFGTSQGPGTPIQDPKNYLFVGFDLNVQHGSETKTLNLNATVVNGGVKIYDGQVSDPAVDYELSYPDQTLSYNNGDVVKVHFLPFALSGNPQTGNLQATFTLTGPNAQPEHITAVYRFFDTATGDHFYTQSTAEKNQIQATLPTYKYEGVGWATPDKSANTIDVFRFFDTATKQHFFTIDAAERDQIIKTLPTYQYEGVAFEAYSGPAAGGSGAVTLERFFNTNTGLHHYAADAGEAFAINHGSAGPGWIDEGKAFTVHVPTDSMLFA